MSIPQKVKEIAKEAGYKWGVEFVREWNGYKVYFPNFKPTLDNYDEGLPQYILVKNNEIRWADNKEQSSLMYLDNQEA